MCKQISELYNSELRTLFIHPLDYRISTKHKSNNYSVQNWGLGDICKDNKKSHWYRCHPIHTQRGSINKWGKTVESLTNTFDICLICQIYHSNLTFKLICGALLKYQLLFNNDSIKKMNCKQTCESTWDINPSSITITMSFQEMCVFNEYITFPI